jgi:hypothetical protein
MNLARFFVAIAPLIAAGQATNPALPSKEYIRLGSRVIAVENAPAPVALTAVANPTNFWPEGGNGTISITVVVAGTNWTAAVDASAASWLSISGPASGTGNNPLNSNYRHIMDHYLEDANRVIDPLLRAMAGVPYHIWEGCRNSSGERPTMLREWFSVLPMAELGSHSRRAARSTEVRS